MINKEDVSFAVAGIAFGVGLSIMLQSENSASVIAGILILAIGVVVLWYND